jgi:hypothetical protein
VSKMKNAEIVVFDLELEIINFLAHKHGLDRLSRDMAAPDFHRRLGRITRAARIEEKTLPDTLPTKFG